MEVITAKPGLYLCVFGREGPPIRLALGGPSPYLSRFRALSRPEPVSTPGPNLTSLRKNKFIASFTSEIQFFFRACVQEGRIRGRDQPASPWQPQACARGASGVLSLVGKRPDGPLAIAIHSSCTRNHFILPAPTLHLLRRGWTVSSGKIHVAHSNTGCVAFYLENNYSAHHFRRTALRRRPPAIDVATGPPPFAARALRFVGVAVPLPGASDAVPDPSSPSSISS